MFQRPIVGVVDFDVPVPVLGNSLFLTQTAAPVLQGSEDGRAHVLVVRYLAPSYELGKKKKYCN